MSVAPYVFGGQVINRMLQRDYRIATPLRMRALWMGFMDGLYG
jgi:hypothetical protein